MSRSSSLFQGGHSVLVLSTTGNDYKKKLKISHTKHIRKVYDKSVKGYVFHISGTPQTSMHMPLSEHKGLGLHQPYLVLQLMLEPTRSCRVEIAVRDSRMTKRRIILSSAFKDVTKNDLHAQLPLNASVKRGVWLNLCLDMPELAQGCFGSVFSSVEEITVGAFAKVRKIFTLHSPPLDTVNDTNNANAVNNERVKANLWPQWEPIPSKMDYATGVSYQTQIYRLATLDIPRPASAARTSSRGQRTRTPVPAIAKAHSTLSLSQGGSAQRKVRSARSRVGGPVSANNSSAASPLRQTHSSGGRKHSLTTPSPALIVRPHTQTQSQTQSQSQRLKQSPATSPSQAYPGFNDLFRDIRRTPYASSSSSFSFMTSSPSAASASPSKTASARQHVAIASSSTASPSPSRMGGMPAQRRAAKSPLPLKHPLNRSLSKSPASSSSSSNKTVSSSPSFGSFSNPSHSHGHNPPTRSQSLSQSVSAAVPAFVMPSLSPPKQSNRYSHLILSGGKKKQMQYDSDDDYDNDAIPAVYSARKAAPKSSVTTLPPCASSDSADDDDGVVLTGDMNEMEPQYSQYQYQQQQQQQQRYQPQQYQQYSPQQGSSPQPQVQSQSPAVKPMAKQMHLPPHAQTTTSTTTDGGGKHAVTEEAALLKDALNAYGDEFGGGIRRRNDLPNLRQSISPRQNLANHVAEHLDSIRRSSESHPMRKDEGSEQSVASWMGRSINQYEKLTDSLKSTSGNGNNNLFSLRPFTPAANPSEPNTARGGGGGGGGGLFKSSLVTDPTMDNTWPLQQQQESLLAGSADDDDEADVLQDSMVDSPFEQSTDDKIDLMYDPILSCYYDPASGSYYALQS